MALQYELQHRKQEKAADECHDTDHKTVAARPLEAAAVSVAGSRESRRAEKESFFQVKFSVCHPQMEQNTQELAPLFKF